MLLSAGEAFHLCEILLVLGDFSVQDILVVVICRLLSRVKGSQRDYEHIKVELCAALFLLLVRLGED